ncbi:MAG: 2-oxo acid dehydrogenase subunit E2 [Chloroflexi bacterium]|nr:2-oxo acid dehydrogenase subunit E2 [Chloroflexota bacterium]
MATAVIIPDIGHGMVSATIVDWLVEEGSPVDAGDPLLTVETEKVTTDVMSPSSGLLRRIICPVGSEVTPNQVVGIIGELEENLDEFSLGGAGEVSESTQPAEAAAPELERANKILAVPAVKRVAKENNINLTLVHGSGPDGRIMMEDVDRAIDAQKSAVHPVSPAGKTDYDVIPLIGIRKTIAERLSLSKRTVADVTTVAEVHMDEVRRLREQVKVSYTAYVVRAVIKATKEFPILNSSLEEDRIIVHHAVNMGVAVATGNGLMVPVIQNAGEMTLIELSEAINRLGEKGRNGELTQEDFEGGTLTVTNSGTFGSLFFTPIINAPQSAVIGIGKVFETPVVREGRVAVGWMMHLCLTYDHRVIDGEPAVKFLQAVKKDLEEPNWMIETSSGK